MKPINSHVSLLCLILLGVISSCSSSEVDESVVEESQEGVQEIQTTDTLSSDDPLASSNMMGDDPTAAPDPSQDLSGAFGDVSAPSVPELPKPQRKIAKKPKKAPQNDFASMGTTGSSSDYTPPPPSQPQADAAPAMEQQYTPPPAYTPQATVAQNTYAEPARNLDTEAPKSFLGNLSKNKVVGAGVLLLAAGGFMLFRRRFSAPKY